MLGAIIKAVAWKDRLPSGASASFISLRELALGCLEETEIINERGSF